MIKSYTLTILILISLIGCSKDNISSTDIDEDANLVLSEKISTLDCYGIDFEYGCLNENPNHTISQITNKKHYLNSFFSDYNNERIVDLEYTIRTLYPNTYPNGQVVGYASEDINLTLPPFNLAEWQTLLTPYQSNLVLNEILCSINKIVPSNAERPKIEVEDIYGDLTLCSGEPIFSYTLKIYE